MSNSFKNTSEKERNNLSHIKPESLSMFSTSLLINNFNLSKENFDESWNSLGLSNAQNSIATGKSGRRFIPKTLTFGTGKIIEKNTSRSFIEEPKTKNQIFGETSQNSTEKNKSLVNGHSYNSQRTTEEFAEKTLENKTSNPNIEAHRQNNTSSKIKHRYFEQKSKDQFPHIDSADTHDLNFKIEKSKKRTPTSSEISETYKIFKNKYAKEISNVDKDLSENLVRENEELKTQLSLLQAHYDSVNLKEQELINHILTFDEKGLKKNKNQKITNISQNQNFPKTQGKILDKNENQNIKPVQNDTLPNHQHFLNKSEDLTSSKNIVTNQHKSFKENSFLESLLNLIDKKLPLENFVKQFDLNDEVFKKLHFVNKSTAKNFQNIESIPKNTFSQNNTLQDYLHILNKSKRNIFTKEILTDQNKNIKENNFLELLLDHVNKKLPFDNLAKQFNLNTEVLKKLNLNISSPNSSQNQLEIRNFSHQNLEKKSANPTSVDTVNGYKKFIDMFIGEGSILPQNTVNHILKDVINSALRTKSSAEFSHHEISTINTLKKAIKKNNHQNLSKIFLNNKIDDNSPSIIQKIEKNLQKELLNEISKSNQDQQKYINSIENLLKPKAHKATDKNLEIKQNSRAESYFENLKNIYTENSLQEIQFNTLNPSYLLRGKINQKNANIESEEMPRHNISASHILPSQQNTFELTNQNKIQNRQKQRISENKQIYFSPLNTKLSQNIENASNQKMQQPMKRRSLHNIEGLKNSTTKINIGRITYLPEEQIVSPTSSSFKRPISLLTLNDYNQQLRKFS